MKGANRSGCKGNERFSTFTAENNFTCDMNLNLNDNTIDYSINFVSIGPGDPELVTIKAFKILNSSDIIYAPQTMNRSRATEILLALGIEETKIRRYDLPMKSDREEALTAYRNLVPEIVEFANQKRKIAIVAEGDGGLYSSVHYLFELLCAKFEHVSKIAGIPAFIAAGALASLHLVSGENKLIIVPSTITIAELQQHRAASTTIVLMKLSKLSQEVKEYLRTSDSTLHYFENIGSPTQLHLTTKPDIFTRQFPYFSLMVVC